MFRRSKDLRTPPNSIKVVNMENAKYTPTNWHWIITPEQIEKIKANDRDTINKVYFDNYDKFKRIAFNKCLKWHCLQFIDDCIQQVYLDLPKYNFTDGRRLFNSICKSFHIACGHNGIKAFSLDAPKGGNNENKQTLFDYLADNVGADFYEQKREQHENERHALNIIAAQTQLSDKDKDILTAIAFGCAAYRGVFAYAFAQAVTA